MAHFLPVFTTINATQLAELFTKEILDSHLMFRAVDFHLSLHFGVSYLSIWLFNKKLSTGFHPQTDGQTEIVNKSLEQYLLCFLDYQQENWLSLLPVAEFAYNNTTHSSLNSSAFQINYGFHPTINLSIYISNNPHTQEFIVDFKTLVETTQNEMKSAQQQQKRFVNCYQHSHDIKVGTRV